MVSGTSNIRFYCVAACEFSNQTKKYDEIIEIMSDFGSSQIQRKNEENMMSNHQTEQADVSHPSKG